MGPRGHRGYQGDAGVPGARGAPGKNGLRGFPGVPGLTGKPGRDGLNGAQGAQGLPLPPASAPLCISTLLRLFPNPYQCIEQDLSVFPVVAVGQAMMVALVCEASWDVLALQDCAAPRAPKAPAEQTARLALPDSTPRPPPWSTITTDSTLVLAVRHYYFPRVRCAATGSHAVPGTTLPCPLQTAFPLPPEASASALLSCLTCFTCVSKSQRLRCGSSFSSIPHVALLADFILRIPINSSCRSHLQTQTDSHFRCNFFCSAKYRTQARVLWRGSRAVLAPTAIALFRNARECGVFTAVRFATIVKKSAQKKCMLQSYKGCFAAGSVVNIPTPGMSRKSSLHHLRSIVTTK